VSASRPASSDPHALPTAARPGWPSRLVHDERGFVLGLLTRAVFWFAVLALVGHDVGRIVWTQVRLSDAAHKAAQAAANSYYQDKAEPRAEQRALDVIAGVDPGIELKGFTVEKDGSVLVETSEQATSFVLGHIGFLKGFTERHVSAHEQRSPF
jgi:Flp pilus assembly protein TadG